MKKNEKRGQEDHQNGQASVNQGLAFFPLPSIFARKSNALKNEYAPQCPRRKKEQ